MQNSSLIGLSRQVALARELDVVANNIANLNTTGYKADGSIFEEFLSPTARAGEGRVSFVRDRGTWHDMSQGSIERTGNALDVAIDGKGFLVVQTPRGERYTRNGALQINPTGTLVNTDGNPVLGESGPITLQPGDRDVSITQDGTVSVRAGASKLDTPRGKLKLVMFNPADATKLRKDGSTAFAPPAGVTAQPAESKDPLDPKVRIVQGSIEKSNVRGVVEITRMIEITRSYSQVAAMLQQQSDMRGSSINKLAEIPA